MGKIGKSSEGRKKVEMKKVESDDARQVCFSKRKKGVFAKAAELSTMCGAEVALLVHSPRGTPYTFGCPSADKIFNKFLTGEQQDPDLEDPNENNTIKQLNEKYKELCERLEIEEARKEALEKRMKRCALRAKECEWVEKIDELGRDQLLQLLGCLYRAKCAINERLNTIYGQVGAEPSNMDVFCTLSPNAGMDLSLAPPAPDSPDGSSNY